MAALPTPGDLNREDRPTGTACHVNFTPILAHEVLTIEKPDPGARGAVISMARCLCGEGEIEDSLDPVLGNTAPIVLDIHIDVIVVMPGTNPEPLGLTFVHGIHGVIDQIDKGLAEIAIEPLNLGKVRRKIVFFLNVVFEIQIPLEKAQLLSQNIVHVESLDLPPLGLPAFLHQHLDNFCHTGALLRYLIDIGRDSSIAVTTKSDQIRGGQYNGKGCSQIVTDPCCELPDDLHGLRLNQLILQLHKPLICLLEFLCPFQNLLLQTLVHPDELMDESDIF